MKNFKQQKEYNILSIAMITVVVLLLASNIATGYYLYSRSQEKKLVQTLPINLENPEKTEIIIEDNRTETKLAKGEIEVEWNDWPVISSSAKIFDYPKVTAIVSQYNKENQYSQLSVDNLFNGFTVYKVGKIRNGEHAEQEIFIVSFREEGPALRNTMYRVIKNDEELILLSRYSDTPWGIYEKLFTITDKILIKNLGLEDEIIEPNTKMKIIRENNPPLALLQTLDNPKKLFAYEKDKYIYRDMTNNCLIAKANDGTFSNYYYKFEFTNKKEEKMHIGSTPYLFDITWNDGIKNKNEYLSREMSCSINCYDYADYISDINQLNEIGQTSHGDKIYELKDKNFIIQGEKESILQNFYNIYHSPDYENHNESFDIFAKNYPIIYWQDPFGDFIEFRNAQYQPLAECGKPVIYLYPEKETDVAVWVAPTGGFKMTEPAYNNGWKVKANPKGEIFNYGDRKSYPYLFWEGYGLNYQRSEEGFVVARAEVKEFLDKKLIQLGLNEKEADEFIAFWQPRLQDKNYYFISFAPPAEFDKLAPLSILPRPGTIIRVFMDYEGLDQYIDVEEQLIITPERKGFTVVEWGGAMH